MNFKTTLYKKKTPRVILKWIWAKLSSWLSVWLHCARQVPPSCPLSASKPPPLVHLQAPALWWPDSLLRLLYSACHLTTGYTCLMVAGLSHCQISTGILYFKSENKFLLPNCCLPSSSNTIQAGVGIWGGAEVRACLEIGWYKPLSSIILMSYLLHHDSYSQENVCSFCKESNIVIIWLKCNKVLSDCALDPAKI